jgi:hypothetical protein
LGVTFRDSFIGFGLVSRLFTEHAARLAEPGAIEGAPNSRPDRGTPELERQRARIVQDQIVLQLRKASCGFRQSYLALLSS